jgi:hypothetical protein
MVRFLPIFALFFVQNLAAQSITWISSCADRTICLNPNQCNVGTGLLTETAVTSCQINPFLNYSYKLDLDNNGSIDQQANEDTLAIALPKGTHRLQWRAYDNCGKVASCTYTVTVKDCQPPNLLCLNGLTQPLALPSCAVTFNASQFILSLSDNCTPTNQIQIGIREENSGTGFPAASSITFDHCKAGLHSLELWTKDANGLTNICNTYVIVQQTGDDCRCITDGDLRLSGCVRSLSGQKMSDFRLHGQVEPIGGTQPLKKISALTSDSCFNLLAAPQLPVGQGYRVRLLGEKNNAPLNGVSTYDLVLISKHILGIEPLPTLYHALAADANRSNSVTTFDIVEIRKLILGIYDTLPAAKSWRFVRPVPNPANYTLLEVAQDTFKAEIPNLQDDLTLPKLDFVGIKIGDVNNSAYPGFAAAPDDRTGKGQEANSKTPLTLLADDLALEPGTELTLPIRLAADAQLSGWQIALAADPALLRIEAVEGLADEDYHLRPDGRLRALWHDAAAHHFPQGHTLFSLKIKVLQKVALSQTLALQPADLRSEAYGDSGTAQPLALHFLGGKATRPAEFLPPSPNPTSGETTFGARLPAPATVRLDLWDAAGRTLHRADWSAPAGLWQWTLPASALPRSGVYGWRVAAGENVWSGKLVVRN